MFLICVCCGYALAAIHIWQYIVTGVLFVLCLLVNGLIALNASRKEKMRLK
jgi:DMSO reductase anchor subunit